MVNSYSNQMGFEHDIFSPNAMNDISDWDDELGDMQKSVRGSSGNAMSFTVKEFADFDGRNSVMAQRISGVVAEQADTILNAAPEGIFDDVSDALKMWGGDTVWGGGKQTESTMKYTYGMQHLRMMNLLNGNVAGQFNKDLRDGFGLTQHLYDVMRFQGRIAGIGVATVAAGAIIVSGGTALLAESVLLSTIGLGATGLVVESITGWGIGVNNGTDFGSWTVQKLAGGIRGVFSDEELEIETDLKDGTVGIAGAKLIVIETMTTDTLKHDTFKFRQGVHIGVPHAVYVERVVTRNGQVFGTEEISLDKYIEKQGDEVNGLNLYDIFTNKNHDYKKFDNTVLISEDTTTLVHVHKVVANSNDPHLTYRYHGQVFDERIPLSTTVYNQGGNATETHYKIPNGKIVYSEFHKNTEDEENELFKPTLSSLLLGTAGQYSINGPESGLTPTGNLITLMACNDVKMGYLDVIRAQKRLNNARKEIKRFEIVQSATSPLIASGQALTFTRSKSAPSIFEAMTLIPQVPLLATHSKVASMGASVANAMLVVQLGMDLLTVGAVSRFSGMTIGNLASKKPTGNILPQKTNLKVGVGEAAISHSEKAVERAIEEEILINNHSRFWSDIGSFKSLNEYFTDAKEMIKNAIHQRPVIDYIEEEKLFNKTLHASVETEVNTLGKTFRSNNFTVKKAIGKFSNRIWSTTKTITAINVVTGKYGLDVVSYVDQNLSNAHEFMFGSFYQALINESSTIAFNTPIVSGLVSGQSFMIIAFSFSAKEMHAYHKNMELANATEELKHAKLEFDRTKSDFGDVVTNADSELNKIGLKVDVEELMKSGEVHVYQYTRTDGVKSRSVTMATVDEAQILTNIDEMKRRVVGAEMDNTLQVKRDKYVLSSSMLSNNYSITQALEENEKMANRLGLEVENGKIYSIGSSVPLTGSSLSETLVERLANTELRNDLQSVTGLYRELTGNNLKSMNGIFSTNEVFEKKLATDPELAARVGVCFIEGIPFDLNEVVDNMFDGNYGRYYSKLESLKYDSIVSNSISSLSGDDIKNKALDYIENGYKGLSNKDTFSNSVMDDYARISKSTPDSIDGAVYSNIVTSNIEYVNIGIHKNFFRSAVILTAFGTRDPLTTEGMYLNDAFTLQPHVHASGISSSMLRSMDTGVPMSIMGFGKYAMSPASGFDSWFDELIDDEFSSLHDNISLDYGFFNTVLFGESETEVEGGGEFDKKNNRK